MVRRLLGAIGIIVAVLAPAAAQTYGRRRWPPSLRCVPAGPRAARGDETKPALASADLNGYGLGAAFGYDWSLGRRWVAGLEADGVVIDGGVTVNGSKYNSIIRVLARSPRLPSLSRPAHLRHRRLCDARAAVSRRRHADTG